MKIWSLVLMKLFQTVLGLSRPGKVTMAPESRPSMSMYSWVERMTGVVGCALMTLCAQFSSACVGSQSRPSEMYVRPPPVKKLYILVCEGECPPYQLLPE